jgi:hypothetical protein
MQERVPAILDKVLERNRDYHTNVKDAVRSLRDGMAADAPLPPLARPSPDAAIWGPGLLARKSETWLGSDWFFVECYAYRSLVGAVRYWETGRDPFAPAKDEELASERLTSAVGATIDACEGLALDERLHHLLGAVLWANRVDLSYSVGTTFGAEGTRDDLVLDERRQAVAALLATRGDVHVLLDNAGTELAIDLVLVAALLEVDAARVVLHVKMHPTFVSDATATDVWALLATLKGVPGPVRGLAQRIERAFWDARILLLPDLYWNSPLFWNARPPHLGLDGAAMVVAKGDANYRRLVGDAIWPDGATLADAVGSYSVPVVCVRTLKSDCLVGVPAERIAALDAADAEWRINSRRGVIQTSSTGP